MPRCGRADESDPPVLAEMSFTDTFYFALCMTVLVVGVVYWFWTQNQYLQRKLNMLELIVLELKAAFNSTVTAPDAILNAALAAPTPAASTKYAPPMDETDDVIHGNLMMAETAEEDEGIAEFEDLGSSTDVAPPPPSSVVAPVAEEAAPSDFTSAWGAEDESPLLATTGGSEADLQPGGGASVKEFVQPDSDASSSVLDGMSLKELRRLAEQKNIPNAKQMKKHELIPAIRHATTKAIHVMEATLSLQ